MKKLRLLFLISLAGFVPRLNAADDQAVTLARINALPAAQREAWRQYLDKSVQQQKRDQDFIATEVKAAGLKDSFAPADAPDFKFDSKKSDAWFASDEARIMAENLISFQTPGGGWSKHVEMTKHVRQKGERFAGGNGWSYVATFDNGATILQLRFLARVVSARESAAVRASFLRGLEYVLAAQYPNGGWPQVYPLMGGYHDAVTFNDDAMTNVLRLLHDIAAGKSGFAFVPPEARTRARAAMERGLACVLESQIVVNGRRTVWCQQHDALTLQPTRARAFEMVAQSGGESAGLLRFLMEIDLPGPPVVAAVHAAADWFGKSALSDVEWKALEGDRQLVSAKGTGPLWARYHEIGTDRPLFGDRDGSVHHDVKEISKERRNGYAWFGTWPQGALKEYETWAGKHPRAQP